jgi:hypothetical protein
LDPAVAERKLELVSAPAVPPANKPPDDGVEDGRAKDDGAKEKGATVEAVVDDEGAGSTARRGRGISLSDSDSSSSLSEPLPSSWSVSSSESCEGRGPDGAASRLSPREEAREKGDASEEAGVVVLVLAAEKEKEGRALAEEELNEANEAGAAEETEKRFTGREAEGVGREKAGIVVASPPREPSDVAGS